MAKALFAALALLVTLAPDTSANHKKPITGAYQALVPVSSTCNPAVPGSQDLHALTLPERGRMQVSLAITGFDMDLYLLNANGGPVATSAGGRKPETIDYKVRRPGKYTIRVCNFLAGPVGDVTFMFTFD